MHSFPFQSRPYRPKAKNLKDWYLKDGLSASQIAERLDVSKTFVLERLHEMGIRVKTGKNRVNNPENFRLRIPPYGWRIRNGKLVLFRPEPIVCRFVINLIRQGRSFRFIARELENFGFKNRKKEVRWDHSTVISIYKKWNEKL